MACPGVAGVLSQLYQAYKQLNFGHDENLLIWLKWENEIGELVTNSLIYSLELF